MELMEREKCRRSWGSALVSIFNNISELEAVLLAPLADHLHYVLYLRVVRVSQQRDRLHQVIPRLPPRHSHLKHACFTPLLTNRSAPLALPELRIRVQSLQHVKRLHTVVEMPHSIAIIGYQR